MLQLCLTHLSILHSISQLVIGILSYYHSVYFQTHFLIRISEVGTLLPLPTHVDFDGIQNSIKILVWNINSVTDMSYGIFPLSILSLMTTRVRSTKPSPPIQIGLTTGVNMS